MSLLKIVKNSKIIFPLKIFCVKKVVFTEIPYKNYQNILNCLAIPHSQLII